MLMLINSRLVYHMHFLKVYLPCSKDIIIPFVRCLNAVVWFALKNFARRSYSCKSISAVGVGNIVVGRVLLGLNAQNLMVGLKIFMLFHG